MQYSYLPLSQARTILSARLYDASVKFWSAAELTAYIQNAIRTWGSLSNYWRSEFTLDTVADTTWYDITDVDVANTTLRPLTITDQSLVNLIQYHLLEPTSDTYPLTWTGSSQFTITDVLGAIQRRRDEILSVTGCTITQRSVAAISGRTFLPDTVLTIRRVAWIPVADGTYSNSPMWPDDEWGLQAFEPNYTTDDAGTPSTYRQSTEPPLSFDVDIPPAIPGQYDILSVDAGVELTGAAAATICIPNDFTWVIVFGALADLLGRDSNAKDVLRAQYCEMRYKQGLAMLNSASAILYARCTNTPLDVDSVQNADNFRTDWQAEETAQPDLLMTTGLNVIGFAPIPDAVYSITLGVVQNAPIPVNDNDTIQLGKDDLDAVIDYAQHLASFKMGGIEFLSTTPLLDRFHKRAMTYNSKLSEMGEFTKPMYELSQLQAETNPTFETDPTAVEG